MSDAILAVNTLSAFYYTRQIFYLLHYVIRSYLAFLLMEHPVLTVEVTELCDLFCYIDLHIRLFRRVTRKDRLQKVKHLDC